MIAGRPNGKEKWTGADTTIVKFSKHFPSLAFSLIIADDCVYTRGNSAKSQWCCYHLCVPGIHLRTLGGNCLQKLNHNPGIISSFKVSLLVLVTNIVSKTNLISVDNGKGLSRDFHLLAQNGLLQVV